MEKDKQRAEIVDLLLNKSAMKQDIADYSEKVLDSFKDFHKFPFVEFQIESLPVYAST